MRGGNHEGVVAHIHSDIRVGIFTVVHVDGGLGGGVVDPMALVKAVVVLEAGFDLTSHSIFPPFPPWSLLFLPLSSSIVFSPSPSPLSPPPCPLPLGLLRYGGCNHRGFDIANHWNEWAGGTQEDMNGRCEYDRFPTPEQQFAFCRAYLEEEGEGGVDDASVEALVKEARQFVAVNHWYWCLWAVNQSALEGVGGFDYLTYAESRAARYYEEKG